MTAAGTLERLRVEGVVAVLRADDPDAAIVAGRALLAGGVRALEVTFTTPDVPRVIAALGAEDGALVGAGTVTTEAEARAAIDAGARYLVSPHVCEAALAVGAPADVLVVPGVLTPTDLVAVRDRTPLLKLFPAGIGGPALLRALLGPFPGTAIMPSGGVTAANVADWFAAGAAVVGAGSDLCPPADVA
ncbi:bifunctional 4-hydroxy-2-oxoglutarate aldolase/2-dehydro-3-deoxy-phosphogluconate aldolase, partial [Patulibacter sp. S7RM1-6]